MSLNRQKVTIEYKYRGTLCLPDTKDAKDIFFRTKQAYANHEKMGLHLIFSKSKLSRLKKYQKGSAQEELDNLKLYIELGEILGFATKDAQTLQKKIELINDTAHAGFNITKRLQLINKKKPSPAKESYLFWDIENFSSVASIFHDVIEPYNIADTNITLAANPDSLYLKRAEWEANLYDYGKTLNSFNFIKCEHGKDVADDVLLEEMKKIKTKAANIFILTFDRDLKERFAQAVKKEHNLFILGR
jgi:hypothetical protein